MEALLALEDGRTFRGKSLAQTEKFQEKLSLIPPLADIRKF